MTPKTVDRKFQAEDIDALVSVWQEANALAHPFLADDYEAQVTTDMRNIYLPDAEKWVLEHVEKPAGFIALVSDEIGGLFLRPSLYGRRLGKVMVDHAISLHGPLRVEVFEKNEIGCRFYERYGFVEIERYDHELSGEVTIKMVMPSS